MASCDVSDFSDESDCELDVTEDVEEESDEDICHCNCGEPDDEQMVLCEAKNCSGSVWYHFQCATGIAAKDNPDAGPWICESCAKCEEGKGYHNQDSEVK